MAGGSTNYYEVLGLPQTASLDEVKKRYRQLARQYHPDVNRDDPNAARKFADVAEAYRVLSDANSRVVHDYELKTLRERTEAAQRRATTTPPGSGAAGAAPRPAAGASAASAGSESARLVAQAQAAFVRNRLVEARTLAEQSLRLNRRNAQAYEVLGDVFRLQNKVDEAMNMYSMALQINPRNAAVMQRLERMSRASSSRASSYGPASRPAPPTSPLRANTPPPSRSSAAPGAGGAYRATASGGAPSYAPRPAPLSSLYAEPEKRSLAQLLMGVFGYGITLLLILWFFIHPGDPPLQNGTPPPLFLQSISTWNVDVWVVLGVAGAVLGWTMTATLAIRRIEDELLLPGTSMSGGRFLPMGAILIVLSFINFYAAALLFLIMQFFQEAVTASMLKVFGAVIGVVGLVAMAYHPGWSQVLLFGGNLVFLSFLGGWFLGDFFRPDGF